jgi:K+-transporting ATPase KdpF subunit
MLTLHVLGGALAALLLCYLGYALLKPENLS